MKRILLFILLLTGMAGTSWSQEQEFRIAVSKLSPNYEKWLQREVAGIEPVNMYFMAITEAVKALDSCHALLLTGGEDVWPGWYGKAFDTVRCTEMNLRRDSLDFALIRRALQLGMPVFGICRGHQILNVGLGGTLIVDIPTDVQDPVVHQCDDYLHCNHPVAVGEGTILSRISGSGPDIVTTNHHQAVDQIAPGLRISAYSSDGVAEALEWESPHGKPFLMGVQWHPERMERESLLSGALARYFLDQAHQYQKGIIKH